MAIRNKKNYRPLKFSVAVILNHSPLSVPFFFSVVLIVVVVVVVFTYCERNCSL